MSLTDLPLLTLLKSSMHWHEARQRVLAENVANADMPDFVPRDLVPMGERHEASFSRAVEVAMTSPRHISGRPSERGAVAGQRQELGWETTPDGNAVTLEEQMMKLTQNQMDHQMATTLYGRSIALLRAAVRSS